MSLSKPTSIIGGFFAFLFAFAFVGLIGSCLITIGIWPGQIKLLAPIFCSDAQPDAFVVADTYSPRPGETVTNFSLYCMGPRGDSTDHGFLKPFLLISVVNGVILMTFFFIIGKLTARAVRSHAGDAIPLSHHLEGDDGETFAPPSGDMSPAPDSFDDRSGLFDSDDDEPRRPNQAPPGSTPGPFVN